MSAEAPTLETGQTVDGKYDIVRMLGQGGMGAVYEAVHRGTSRRVALKVIVSAALAKEDGVLARFQREARASGSIDSAHVVQVLDTGVEPATGNPYMVMEYLSGEDVHDLIKRLGPLDPMLAVRIVAQACLGLQRAHDAGIVHRDIKSANMYLARRDGGEMTLKLLDFGIAKVRADGFAANDDQHLTRTGSLLGSPLFMSPEQARGVKNLDGRADLWSLGVVLYQALTGRTPNDDKETLGDLIIAICTEEAPPVQRDAPWVSPELGAVVRRALARDAKDRYASAKEMHDALAALSPGGIGLREDMLVALPGAVRSHIAKVLSQPTVLTPLQVVHTPAPENAPASPLASTHAAPEGHHSSPPGSYGGRAITGGTGGTPVPMGSGGTSGAGSSKSAARVMLLVAVAVAGLGGVGAIGYSRRAKPESTGAAIVSTTSSSSVASAQPEPSTHASSPSPSPAAEIVDSGAALPSTVELAVKPVGKPNVASKELRVAQVAAPSATAAPKPKPTAAPAASAPPPSTEPSVKRTF